MYWIRNCVKPDDVIIDVGENVGPYNLLLGKIVQNGNSIVYAIEPESGNYSALNKNIVINNLTGTVVAYSLAIGETQRLSAFYLSNNVVGSSMYTIDRLESDRVDFEP